MKTRCKTICNKKKNENKNYKIIILEGNEASVDIKYLSIFIPATLILCYIIAVSKGHVIPWLPYISDCAVGYPEAYIFRSGMTLTSFFGMLSYYEFYVCINRFNKTILPFISLIFGIIANLGLAGVAVVNERENHKLHIISAVVFFAFQLVYMWLIILNIRYSTEKIHMNKFNNETIENEKKENEIITNKSYNKNKRSIKIKTIISTIYSIDMFYFCINYNKNVPLCEWIGVFLIVFYNLTFCLDFKNNLYIGIYLN